MRFDAEHVRTSLAQMPCRTCGGVGGRAVLGLEGPHFARISCLACGGFLDWLGWPPSPERPERRRTARRAQTLATNGDPFCELCLRTAGDLPAGEKIATHHLDEDSQNNDAANLRAYCTGCHQLAHWLRTYFGHQVAA